MDIGGRLEASIGVFRGSFAFARFLAFIWAPEVHGFVHSSLRKLHLKRATYLRWKKSSWKLHCDCPSLMLHNFSLKDWNWKLFLAIIKPSQWQFQWGEIVLEFQPILSAQRAKPWAYRSIYLPNPVLFSRSQLISQAWKVEMRQFERPKSSTWCCQCRKALGKVSESSGKPVMHHQGSCTIQSQNRHSKPLKPTNKARKPKIWVGHIFLHHN